MTQLSCKSTKTKNSGKALINFTGKAIRINLPACAGCLAGPANFSIQPPEHTKSQSMESRVQQVLDAVPAFSPHSSLEAMEHLAILKRWYYRGTRVGEIFFADNNGDLPMRRIVRGISRVYRGETPEIEMRRSPSQSIDGVKATGFPETWHLRPKT